MGRSERVRGVRGVAGGAQGNEGAARQGGGGARVRRAHALLPTGRRLKTVAAAVGWAAQCWTSTGAGPALVQVSSPGTSLTFLICFLFYFCYFVLI